MFNKLNYERNRFVQSGIGCLISEIGFNSGLVSLHPQQEALSSPIPSELLVGALPVVPIEPLTSPGGSDRESQPQSAAVSEPDAHLISGHCGEVSPHPSDPVDTPMICSPSLVQDTTRAASTAFSPPAGSQTSASVSNMEAQVQYQVPHQHQVPQNFFAETQANAEPGVSQPPGQVQLSVSQPQSSSCTPAHGSSSPLCVSVPVPLQQTATTAASALLSEEGDETAVQQHTQNSEFNRSLFQK